jgi:hypothetical protein
MSDFNPVQMVLDAVDKLTVTKVTVIWQEFELGPKSTKVTQPPLILMLRQAIASSTSGSGGGGALPNQRSVIDGDALDMYEKLSKDILKAYKSVTTAAPFQEPEKNLRQWFIAVSNQVRGGKLDEGTLLTDAQIWFDWIRIIEDKLFPPTTLEVVAPCPVEGCGKRWAKSAGGDSIPAIVIQHRPPSSDRVNALAKSHAKCRACGTVWRGDRKLRELAFDIDRMQVVVDIRETADEF